MLVLTEVRTAFFRSLLGDGAVAGENLIVVKGLY